MWEWGIFWAVKAGSHCIKPLGTHVVERSLNDQRDLCALTPSRGRPMGLGLPRFSFEPVRPPSGRTWTARFAAGGAEGRTWTGPGGSVQCGLVCGSDWFEPVDHTYLTTYKRVAIHPSMSSKIIRAKSEPGSGASCYQQLSLISCCFCRAFWSSTVCTTAVPFSVAQHLRLGRAL